MNSITLSELTEQIKFAVNRVFDSPVWIRAEVAELRENANGHCYIEFIEKDVNFGECDYNLKMILTDAQTSGGLLMGVKPENVNKVINSFMNNGFHYSKVIGEVIGAGEGFINVE